MTSKNKLLLQQITYIPSPDNFVVFDNSSMIYQIDASIIETSSKHIIMNKVLAIISKIEWEVNLVLERINNALARILFSCAFVCLHYNQLSN